MENDTKEYLETVIAALSQDIEAFGPAGDDLARLARYRAKLGEVNAIEGSAA